MIFMVKEGNLLSYVNCGWEKFIDVVIDVINEKKEGVIFVLWGLLVQKKGEWVDINWYFILKLLYFFFFFVYCGFFESKFFLVINNELEKQGKKKICWV